MAATDLKKVLYLHGYHGCPRGVRTAALEAMGLEVVAPTLPDVDMAAAVQIAQANLDGVDLVIGSSRGAAVAMQMTTEKPVLLLSPAWRMFGVEPKVPNLNTYIVAGFNDEQVPYEDAEELAGATGTGGNLLLLTDNHKLEDSLAVIVMLAQEIIDGEI